MILDRVQIGDRVEHRGIVVAPLFPRSDPVTQYITLDEALPQGLRIREVDDAGTVPELVVENPLDSRVLLYDGEERERVPRAEHDRPVDAVATPNGVRRF